MNPYSEELSEAEDRIVELEAQLAWVRAANDDLKAENAKLKLRLAIAEEQRDQLVRSMTK